MKLSIITPVYNSHEILRRQILHYERMNLPDDVEIIFVDDGSDPPLSFCNMLKNFRIISTHDTRPWTEHLARNKGVASAKGRYVAIIDIDYILPLKTICEMISFKGDRLEFVRRFGMLDEQGYLKSDKESLISFQIRRRWKHRDSIPGHRSQFMMKKSLFQKLGGYREDLYGVTHPGGGGAGQRFWYKWLKEVRKGRAVLHDKKLDIFFYPTGKYVKDHNDNPLGLFHNLKRVS